MSKVSAEFGKMIAEFLKRNGLTFRAAGLQSSISAAYWKDMSDGRVPSEEVVIQISGCFDDLDANKLLEAAGYSPRFDGMDALSAVEFVMHRNNGLPEEGKKQILEFVREVVGRYPKQGS